MEILRTLKVKQIPKIQIILDNKEKINIDIFNKTEEIKRLRKYFRIKRRKVMLESIKRFCEDMIIKIKNSKYQSELIQEIEHIKGRF